MKISCLLHWHGLDPSLLKPPTEEELKTYDKTKVEEGIWKGYGFYYTLESPTFREHHPLYISVGDFVEFKTAKASDN